jgi:hypothetical protein
MADKTPPKPITPSRPKRPPVTVSHQPRKREAAERRALKNDS